MPFPKRPSRWFRLRGRATIPSGSCPRVRRPRRFGQTIGTTCEGVGVAGRASPRVGVGGREDDVVGIGPVVMKAFPDAARAFGDVGLGGAAAMHLEVLIGAVAKKVRAARSEVGEPATYCSGVEVVVWCIWIV